MKVQNCQYFYLIFCTSADQFFFSPNRRSLKGSNAIIQLGYSGSKIPWDLGFLGFPGFRRVPDRRIRRVSQGSRLPWVPKGFAEFQGFLRIPEVLKFPKDPKLSKIVGIPKIHRAYSFAMFSHYILALVVPQGFPGFQGFQRFQSSTVLKSFSSLPRIPNFSRSSEFPGYPTFV